MAILDLTIDDLGAQGDGIAHIHNTTIFIAGALAGEKVRVEIDETHAPASGTLLRGTLKEIVVPSSQRTKPPCPHFPVCGGCRFQHMTDAAYTVFKTDQLRALFAKARLETPAFLPPIVTANQTRRRLRVACRATAKGVQIGFNEWRSQSIVDVHHCEVIAPPLLDMMNKLRAILAHWLPKNETCDIQLTWLPEGIDLVIIGGPRLELRERQALGEIAQKLGVARLSWRKWDRSPIEPIAHNKSLAVRFGESLVPFPPGSFLQATQTGEEALTSFAAQAAGSNHDILDLYCGLGTFGLSVESPRSIHFCDMDGPAVQALESAMKGKANIQVSQRNLNIEPFSTNECDAFDVVIFDPPRGGAKAQAERLAKSKVPVVIAISCDPPSLMRDAQILVAGGYQIAKILPVDQFLWSPHLEVAVSFVR